MRPIAALFVLLATHSSAFAQNTLYPTPYMGLNTFYTGLPLNQTNVHALADSLVSTGLAAAGWTLLSIDTGWATGTRDGGTGEPQWGGGFAAGMAAAATYIHGKGLKAGIYSDSGPTGFGGALGSWTHYPNDLDWFYNQWGYDFVKFDTCGWRATTVGGCELGDYQNSAYPYTVIPTLSAAALSTVGKQYAIEGPTDSDAGNISWALNPLVHGMTSWYAMTDGFGFIRTASAMTYIVHHPGAVGPYNYPHPDMLEFNKGALTFEQEVANFEMYAILSAPLMLGADPSGLDASDLAVLTNSEIIGINQDTAVNGALRVGSDNADFSIDPTGAIVLYKYLTTAGTRAVFLFHRGGGGVGNLSIGFTNADIGLTGTFNVRDVRTQTNLATGVTSYTNASIAPGEGQLLKITAGTDTWINSYQIATGSNSTVSPFAAALNQVDGVTQSTANAIDRTGCGSNCAPEGVYQKARVGQALLVANGNIECAGSYKLCGGGPAIDTNVVVQPGSYRVRLHFSENWKSAANQRKFNVAINNVQVLTDLDVYAETGAQYKAIYKDVIVTTSRPLISVTAFPGSVDQAMISGIEVSQAAATVPFSGVAH
jgi:hypothetical protein